MGNKNCWMEVFQLKNALLKYKENLLNFSESILVYNIHYTCCFSIYKTRIQDSEMSTRT